MAQFVSTTAVVTARRGIQATAVVGALLLLGLGGCSGTPSRIAVPAMDPKAAGTEALAEYDTNKDGAIAGPELDASPGLKFGLRTIDANHDGKLTADEIAARIRKYQDSKYGVIQFLGTVTLDGAPLRGATVTLVPEKFMGAAVKKSQGKTDDAGSFLPAVEDIDAGGARSGVYRIEISAKDASGQETIPAKYNTETILGAEVGVGSPVVNQGLELNLSSR